MSAKTPYQQALWASAHAQAAAVGAAHRRTGHAPRRAAAALFRTLKAALTAQP
jgi:hypothetical protein